jgi:hypothetical protein
MAVMKRSLPALITLSLPILVGCQGQRVDTSNQRFVLVANPPQTPKGDAIQGTYALDTKTGQLCVPFDPATFTSVTPLPTCAKLFHDFPDTK